MNLIYALLGKPRPRARIDESDAEVKLGAALEDIKAPKQRLQSMLDPTGFPLGDGVLGRRAKPSNNSREHEG